jgi:hypothetical protein
MALAVRPPLPAAKARPVVAANTSTAAAFRCQQRYSDTEAIMARYSRSAKKDVKSAMRRRKTGKLKSGKGGKGGRVKSRKQAIAIGLSEARKKGKKVPRKKGASRKS